MLECLTCSAPAFNRGTPPAKTSLLYKLAKVIPTIFKLGKYSKIKILIYCKETFSFSSRRSCLHYKRVACTTGKLPTETQIGAWVARDSKKSAFKFPFLPKQPLQLSRTPIWLSNQAVWSSSTFKTNIQMGTQTFRNNHRFLVT